jgi:hypothetical protein
MDECAKCGAHGIGQSVRVYYGTKTWESAQSYGNPKTDATTTVVTTTRYSVGGWDDVDVCDRCTKKRSRSYGLSHGVWSLPLALVAVAGAVAWFSGNLPNNAGTTTGNYYASILIASALGLGVIITAVGSVSRLVKPLNEGSRIEVARKVVKARYAGTYDTFWTQEEFEKLQLTA